jgi:hypothetical protein
MLWFPEAGIGKEPKQVILKGIDPEERGSGPGKMEREVKSQESVGF